MIEPLAWPQQTNSDIRDAVLADKVNEIVAFLNQESTQCLHESTTYVLNPKIGTVRCKNCGKVWKQSSA